MSADWYPGITAFCGHWPQAPMLQHTFRAFEKAFADENDACIDAAKAMVECACRVIIENVDDKNNPEKPEKTNPSFGDWLNSAFKVLGLNFDPETGPGDPRDRAFSKLVSEHNKLATALDALRNQAGPVSHGRDGFITELSAHHRRTAVLAADAIITFLHETYLGVEPDPVLMKNERYERFQRSNELIDQYAAIDAGTDEEGLHVTIIMPNDDEIPLRIDTSLLLFSADREAYKSVLNACKEEDGKFHAPAEDEDNTA